MIPENNAIKDNTFQEYILRVNVGDVVLVSVMVFMLIIYLSLFSRVRLINLDLFFKVI